MTERVKSLLDILQKREYKDSRVIQNKDISYEVSGLTAIRRDAYRLTFMLDAEAPMLFKNERIGFNRSLSDFPYFFYEDGRKSGWSYGDLAPNYKRIMEQGFDGILLRLAEKRKNSAPARYDFIDSLVMTIEASLRLADRYREAAKERNPELFEALCRVPRKSPESFYQACVFMKFIIFTLRCNANSHLTLGRFDQYMLSYYQADRDRGVGEDAVLDILEEFFVSINFDTDLYKGVQQGDNGQSMMLGGYDGGGRDMYNRLSSLCMRASAELNLIDPKINLRVNSKTPIERYIEGTRLSRRRNFKRGGCCDGNQKTCVR